MSSLTKTMCRGGTAAAMAMVLSMGCADGGLGDNALGMGPDFRRGGGTDPVVCAIGADVGTSIYDLCVATTATSFKTVRIRDGLIDKLNLASSKLGEDKTADAVMKLQDYVSNLTAMRDAALINPRKAKVDAGAATTLIAGAQAIIDFLDPPDPEAT